MSLEVTCKVCDEEFDMRHGHCPACAYRLKHFPKLEAVREAAPESAELLRKFLGFGPSTKLELALVALEEQCQHPNAVSARNEVIKAGLYCPDCKNLLPEIEEQDG